VNNGSGIVAAANVTNVAVICTSWIWESGSNTLNQYGTYGTLGTPAAGNVPGARQNAVSWTDTAGNLWLFGGLGLDGATGDPPGDLNDLWEYTPPTGPWVWQSGSSSTGAFGDYGQLGVPEGFNVPGARLFATSWTDAQGNFWLFGGSGVDSNGITGSLNDLWEFTPPNGPWVWQSGSEFANQAGIYGTQGAGSTTNAPGSRVYALSWTDAAGNLWLFGGEGEDSNGNTGELNDLWEFTPGNLTWTWVSGSNINGAFGTYGNNGVAAPGNVPGSRDGAVAWTDASGNFWLFGGYGPVVNAGTGDLNDLWEYSTVTGLWTWVSGSNGLDAAGAYGTQGTPSVNNAPGARDDASVWVDSAGNLWLFGGSGYDSTAAFGPLNDMWLFNPTAGTWIFIADSKTTPAFGIYGTLGVAAAANVPGARLGASSWTDPTGDFWLFGGFGYGTAGEGFLNDLWFYPP
jgi:N-acetylneuraminic acid mutarotase